MGNCVGLVSRKLANQHTNMNNQELSYCDDNPKEQSMLKNDQTVPDNEYDSTVGSGAECESLKICRLDNAYSDDEVYSVSLSETIQTRLSRKTTTEYIHSKIPCIQETSLINHEMLNYNSPKKICSYLDNELPPVMNVRFTSCVNEPLLCYTDNLIKSHPAEKFNFQENSMLNTHSACSRTKSRVQEKITLRESATSARRKWCNKRKRVFAQKKLFPLESIPEENNEKFCAEDDALLLKPWQAQEKFYQPVTEPNEKKILEAENTQSSIDQSSKGETPLEPYSSSETLYNLFRPLLVYFENSCHNPTSIEEDVDKHNRKINSMEQGRYETNGKPDDTTVSPVPYLCGSLKFDMPVCLWDFSLPKNLNSDGTVEEYPVAADLTSLWNQCFNTASESFCRVMEDFPNMMCQGLSNFLLPEPASCNNDEGKNSEFTHLPSADGETKSLKQNSPTSERNANLRAVESELPVKHSVPELQHATVLPALQNIFIQHSSVDAPNQSRYYATKEGAKLRQVSSNIGTTRNHSNRRSAKNTSWVKTRAITSAPASDHNANVELFNTFPVHSTRSVLMSKEVSSEFHSKGCYWIN